MSIHFRSRIQSPINYSTYLFPGVSGCCCTGSSEDGAVPFESTFGACNALNGYFSMSPDCKNSCFPKGKTGCCCASFYSGMSDGIEKTQCEDLNGIWSSSPCKDLDSEKFCITGDKDIRLKKKCCGYTLIDGSVESRCYSVDTEEECSKLTVKGYTPVFYETGETCQKNPECPSIIQNKKPNNTTFLTGVIEKDTYGNCCIQGIPCRCIETISFYDCDRLNGSFYLLGDKEFSCSECERNCTNGEP